MPDLFFAIEGVEPLLYAAAPAVTFKLRVYEANTASETTFHSVLLRCQIRIEPTRRHYQPGEQSELYDLFDRPSRWGETLRSMLWTHATVAIPPFAGSTTVDLPVPCSYDFNLAATKYFAALESGDIPLCLLFSGTMFYAGDDGALQVAQISWEREAAYRLPIEVWRAMMQHYYPDSVWLRIPQSVFDRLRDYKKANRLATWDEALERLLPAPSAQSPTTHALEPALSDGPP